MDDYQYEIFSIPREYRLRENRCHFGGEIKRDSRRYSTTTRENELRVLARMSETSYQSKQFYHFAIGKGLNLYRYK